MRKTSVSWAGASSLVTGGKKMRPLLKRRSNASQDLNYVSDFWGPIGKILDEILNENDDCSGGADIPASSDVVAFESKYRLVYFCVINSQGERLAIDLFRKVRDHVKEVSAATESEDAVEFILHFYHALHRYFRAFNRIQEIFLYFDRAFLQPKMGTRVETELNKLLKALLFDFHGEKLLPLLEQFVDVSEEPREIYAYIIDQFHSMSPEVLERYPGLMRRFGHAPPIRAWTRRNDSPSSRHPNNRPSSCSDISTHGKNASSNKADTCNDGTLSCYNVAIRGSIATSCKDRNATGCVRKRATSYNNSNAISHVGDYPRMTGKDDAHEPDKREE